MMNPISRRNLRATDRSIRMWMVLAHSFDESALWMFQRLHSRARHEVKLVLVEALEPAETTWAHRVGQAGGCIDVQLRDGRRLETMTAGAVLNRLTWPALALAVAAPPVDATYAQSEARAFAMSWIRSLASVVVNAPTSQGLCGRWRPTLHWRILGSQAGLPVAPLQMSSAGQNSDNDVPSDSTMVLTVGGELLWRGAPTAIRKGVRRLAEMSETPILGLRFVGADPAAADWRLLDATPQPDLRIAGERGVAALEELLAA
jgi:hypothetical protein